MRRLITLVSHPDNASVVRAELRAIDGQYGRHVIEKPRIPDVPCPYIASLLGSAWTTNLEAGQEKYTSGVTLEQALLPAWMGCWDDDNNDGISILDVTEPDRPAYCFLLSEDVLNAHSYLSAYHHIGEYKVSPPEGDGSKTDDDVDDNTEGDTDNEGHCYFGFYEECRKRCLWRAVHALHGIPIIRANLLREAWPEVDFRDAAPATTVVAEADIPPGPLSLTDLTLDVAVKRALDIEDTSGLERLTWLPGKAGEIKKALRNLNPFPDSGTQLLIRALSELKEGSRVDLSYFQLSGTQLVGILSHYGEIAFLDVSFNNVLVADDIPKLLEVHPTLRRLVVIGCRSVLDAHILALAQNEPSRFKSLEGLLHPAFLTIRKPDPYPVAFTFVDVRASGNLACASVPFFTPAQIVQALIDVLPWRDSVSDMDVSLPLVGCSAFHGGARTPDKTFSQRAVVSVPFLSPLLPRCQKDFWAFVVSPGRSYGRKNLKSMWGFVHFRRSEDDPAAAPSTPATDSEGAPTPTPWPPPARPLECSGRVYDLRGFLECMKSEERPMPSDAIVKELEQVLYKKDYKTGEFCCPLMTEEDVQEVEQTGGDFVGERYDDRGFRF